MSADHFAVLDALERREIEERRSAVRALLRHPLLTAAVGLGAAAGAVVAAGALRATSRTSATLSAPRYGRHDSE